ncbi:MAG: hypothetical protein EYC62_09310 [Alphaproteobacteria bacterium]|nr:MAG: hypothetical protein EYC62_09310 [Alphaproteobacteria bacterium]
MTNCKKFLAILGILFLGSIIFTPHQAHAQSGGAGGGGVIMNFDIENFLKENEQLYKAYQAVKELQDITNYQKLITKTLGLKEDQIAFLRTLGNIANTICNTRFPPFFFNFNFDFRLPDFPDDPCDIALTFLPYDTNYYTEFVGNINQTLNDPAKVHKVMRNPQKALSVMRESLWSDPNDKSIETQLGVRKRRQTKFQRDMQNMLTNSTTAQATAPDKIMIANEMTRTKPDTQIAQLTLLSEQIKEDADTNIKIMSLLADQNAALGMQALTQLPTDDPRGSDGRLGTCNNNAC